MITRLTRADYCEPEWGQFELSEDWASYRTFWASVLMFAAADNARAVHYQLDQDDDCLAIEVEEGVFNLLSPPEEYRHNLLDAARRLAAGGRLLVALGRLSQTFFGIKQVGRLRVESPPKGEVVEWRVEALPNGLRFERARSAPASSL